MVIFSPFAENTRSGDKYAVKDFARNAAICSDSKDVIAYCKVESSFIYYFGRDVGVENNVDRIYELYSGGSGIIAADKSFEQLKEDNRFLLLITGVDNSRGLFMKVQ